MTLVSPRDRVPVTSGSPGRTAATTRDLFLPALLFRELLQAALLAEGIMAAELMMREQRHISPRRKDRQVIGNPIGVFADSKINLFESGTTWGWRVRTSSGSSEGRI